MLQSDALAVIEQIEAALPVETWTSHGFRVWPLVRLYLAFTLPSVAQASPQASWLARARQARGRVLRAGLEGWQGAGDAAGPLACDAMFISHSAACSVVDGHGRNRLCDPVADALAGCGLRAAMLNVGEPDQAPRRIPGHYLQPRLDRVRLNALFARRGTRLALPELEVFLRPRFGERFTGLGQVIGARAALVRALAEEFKVWLVSSGARLGCQGNYYAPYGMAFNLACRELGLPVVDIQHGVAGDANVAYGRWRRMPPGGYALLPSAFWCWTAADAAAVEHWGATGIVGGNPMLDVSPDPRTEAGLRELASVDAPHVLYTLQGIEPAAELDRLFQAIALRPGWCWWLRCHPARPEQAAALADRAARQGDTRIEIARASEPPLPALMRHAHAHATGFSATVLEAEALGVPSVVCHPDARWLLAPQLARGSAVFAATAEELVAALEACLAAGTCASNPADPRALDRLVALMPPPTRGAA